MIIGLSGRKQAGKDTVASYLFRQAEQNLNLYVERYGFADSLKDTCMQFFGLSYDQCYGTDMEKNEPSSVPWWRYPGETPSHVDRFGPMTVREVLQYFGALVRAMNPDAFVQATLHNIEDDDPELALITDVRFPNEVQAIHAAGGKVIRLTRSPLQDSHVSEHALDDWTEWDLVIDNQDLTVEATNSLARLALVGWANGRSDPLAVL